MNWSIAVLTAVFGGLVPFVLAWVGGTLVANPAAEATLKLTYFRHWGVCVGDTLLLPIVNGLVWDHLEWGRWWGLRTIGLGLAALGLTWWLHRQWWPDLQQPVFGLHFATHAGSAGNPCDWWRDLTPCGWVHIAFMTAEVCILGTYIFSPAPRVVIWTVGAILGVFPLVAAFEPSWVINRGIDRTAAVSAGVVWLATAVVTAGKLALTR